MLAVDLAILSPCEVHKRPNPQPPSLAGKGANFKASLSQKKLSASLSL
jgi:hypothetical protein